MPVYVHVIDHRPTDVNPPDLTYDVDRSQQLDERAIL